MSKTIIPKGVKLYFNGSYGETPVILNNSILATFDFENDKNIFWKVGEDVEATMKPYSDKIEFTLTKNEKIWIIRGEESPKDERLEREMEEDRMLFEMEESDNELPLPVSLSIFERHLRIELSGHDIPSKIYMTQGTKIEFLKSMMFENVLEVVDEVKHLLSFEGYCMEIIVDNDLPHGDFRME